MQTVTAKVARGETLNVTVTNSVDLNAVIEYVHAYRKNTHSQTGVE